MRVSKPNSLELAYTRKMMSFLLFQPHPKSILMLGLGGGSLAKFCYQHLPETKITVIEINPHVLAFRNEFKIPENSERFQVMLGDAAEYVASCHSNYDVIATDAFDKHGFSSSVCNREFYENLHRLLADNGLIVSNMAGRREERMAHLKMLSDIFGERTLAIPVACDGNHVALAFSEADFEPCWQTVHGRAKLLGKSIGLDFENLPGNSSGAKSWITSNDHFCRPSGYPVMHEYACPDDLETSPESMV
ncbi:MAG: fused MFS/spermidine synthase [Dechloromonas sp.]|uniref:Fused MFS/spermidine synthase n=1 Tax=Candidatus Dechloromonas phosphorivorans TaxID=2899244 RepID=A0A935JZX4_9RHOO|nr:fused MFS/spermidine synthase [Candidatus Dechloromonas phosphorivorans]